MPSHAATYFPEDALEQVFGLGQGGLAQHQMPPS